MLRTSHDIIFLHGDYFPHQQWRTDKYYDGYYSLKLMTRGRVELWYDQKGHDLDGAWFWPAYPGPRIRFHAASGHSFWEHRYVTFRGPLVNRWRAAKLWLEEPQRVPEKDYAPVFDELLAQARRSDRWSTLRATNLLERILIDLAEARAQAVSPEPWLGRVLEELHKDRFVPDYEGIASACNMGLSTLRRRFKRAMGTTLHGYVMQSRICTARELLLNTDLPIGTIAERLGYKDVYFFSAQFRRQVGLSPTAYRNSRQRIDERPPTSS